MSADLHPNWTAYRQIAEGTRCRVKNRLPGGEGYNHGAQVLIVEGPMERALSGPDDASGMALYRVELIYPGGWPWSEEGTRFDVRRHELFNIDAKEKREAKDLARRRRSARRGRA